MTGALAPVLRPSTPARRVPSRPGSVDGADRDPVGELVHRLRTDAPRAVDADEIAALLEASGITDQTARQAYGAPELFTLAEQVFARLWVPVPGPRHGAVPVRWDWRGLGHRPMLGVRLVAGVALAAAAWWLGTTALLLGLTGVPLAELLAAWHRGHLRWGLISYDTTLAWQRHLRTLGWVTLAALTPPLLAGVALASESDLPRHGTDGWFLPAATGGDLLPWAVGVLAAGGYAVLLLLAARRRAVTGAVLAVACGAAVMLVHPPAARVAVIAAGYLVGLLVAAHAVFDTGGHR